MKKISNFCMLLLLLCTTFFVFNVNYTREVVRIQEMGKTVDSLDLYLKDINEPAASVLRFFEDVSKEYKVSIIKTDSGDEVVKSGVFDKDTFPYQEFGISSLDFTTDGEGVYSNKEISNKLGTIPTFLKAKPIQLMTFQTYIKDTSRSLNGRYTITSTQEMDKDRIVQKWSDFFKIDQATLLEPTYKSAVEVINRDLLLSAIVFVLAILLLVLVTVYQPMMEMKRVGVQKLLGFQDRAVLADVVKGNLYLLLGGALVINLGVFFLLDYKPKDLFPMLWLSHFLLLQLYLFISWLTYLLIQKMTISSLLKGFSSFKFGLIFNYVMKIGTTILLTALLIGVGRSLEQENKELAYQQQWVSQGNYLTLETFKLNDNLWQEELAGSGKSTDYFYRFYQDLVEKTQAGYVQSSSLPVKNFVQSEQIQQYQLTDTVDVYYANRNFLKSKGFKLPDTGIKKVILMPASTKGEEDKNQLLGKLIAFHSMKYEEQQKRTIEDMDVEIAYYEGDWSFFPYSDKRKENLSNPIISLVNDSDMMWDEKASLSTTGLNNPIKIENTVQHQKEITELVEKLSDGNYLKFSSIQAIQQEKVDSYRDAVRNFNLLFALFGLLSMMISYFLLVTTFLLKRRDIITKKFMGWKLVDRYRPLLVLLLLGYSFPLLVLIFFAHAFLPLLLFAGFTCLDILFVLGLASRMEKRSLVELLKGGIL
ncbi:bacteriocin immunity protein [Streptococcus pneumoniae]|uniref:bacteriocin-associated integral membrane family protein n=1 Tax=Streptococcus pneumoniae TaxID=1313 RepID=UPI0007651016|nr:bacteriocin-associated integral membrane family protein [Streptococcus pneumoniae]CVM31560.1 bacteriocin immunity protein [Streptococcus pneumoniae]CVR23436.1 bacteriocin immunity protein [Streptococcus pneumoniae]CVT12381.1 bacteriocin immunity protein [Streptococcus pneumoniae]CWA31321.1 bacteriocin immunity protein [Streptococcus pneumoniae]VNK26082.1 bacteriocin immunity protein [Streptococcus pneumoniae]